MPCSRYRWRLHRRGVRFDMSSWTSALTAVRSRAPMEVATSRGGRVHILRAREGTLDVRYSATVARTTMQPAPVDVPGIELVHDEESLEALRQSRYCPSDRLAGFADFEFADVPRGPDLPSAVAAWVFERIAYRSGVSDHLDTAVETLVAGEGVCRDFAHLTISLCRALRVPARFVAVYAPGLSPMDFHAVAEARIGAGWEIVDPTRCAPRSSLVRVATGRDAADTAFATTLRGRGGVDPMRGHRRGGGRPSRRRPSIPGLPGLNGRSWTERQVLD